jgi:GH35 family endo-1,4-beta-xylanase
MLHHIKLYINEYNIEEANAKSDALLALVERLLHRGIPIHGFGTGDETHEGIGMRLNDTGNRCHE